MRKLKFKMNERKKFKIEKTINIIMSIEGELNDKR
jgi:hypothetical protein